MAITFSTEVLDAHIAPGVSAFTLAEIPDMTAWSKQSSHWIANSFLNPVFNGSFAPPMNAYAYNFLRRAQYAFSEHELARCSTLAFIAGGSQSVSTLMRYFIGNAFLDKLGTDSPCWSKLGKEKPSRRMTDH